MIEPRIYRAAFLPALLALVLVAFSLVTAPRAVPQGLAADALFEGTGAVGMVRDIVGTTPDRRAGRPGDARVASRVKQAFLSHGFPTTIDRWSEDGVRLANVIGRRPGATSKQIVVMAARDAATVPDESGSAADTAALIEFARVFEGRASRRTLVLASVDGSQLGDAGARRFAESIGNPRDIEAVIVLSNLGATRSRGPLVIGWSNDANRGNFGIEQTVASSLREELVQIPHQEGAFAQFARLTFPLAPGGQGVLLQSGIDAVRISGSGELRPPGRGEHVDVQRYGSLGRGALRVVSSLDASAVEPKHGPPSYIQFAGKLMPAWPVRLLALAFVLPALIASIDAFARARRRREPVAVWLVWLASALLPFVLGLALALLLVLVGIARDAPPAPLDPHSLTLDSGAWGSLIATVLAVALAWVLGRSSVIRRAASLPDASAPGAACIASLALSLLVLVLVFTNPYAALLLIPAVHLWMLATLTDVRWRGGLVMFLLGLLPVVGVALYYLVRFELGPIQGAWYTFLLVTGNQTGVLTTACLVVLAAITGSVAAILLARARHGDPALGDGGPGAAGAGGGADPPSRSRRSSGRADMRARARSARRARLWAASARERCYAVSAYLSVCAQQRGRVSVARDLKRSLSILVLLGIAALVAFSPASLAAKKKCVSMKEHAGCKLKLAAYTGRETSGGPMYGARLSIDAENGPARVTGAVRGKCSGGGADGSTTYLPIVTAPRFPKTLVVGKTYSKSAHIDRTETSPGSNGAHLVATETIKIDVLSAKRARVTVSTDQSSNFETTADDPRHCKGSGSEKLKRRY